MKLLLDENISLLVKEFLKKNHYNVKSICSKLKGLTDIEVFNLAQSEQRCLITKDSDFLMYNCNEHFGIIKIDGIFNNPEKQLVAILKKYKDSGLKNTYIVLKKDGYEEITKKYNKKKKFKQFFKIRLNYFNKNK